ncbi:MAG: HAD family hydrolase [Anaerostipes sp.]|jgi:HAD superfamily hydrolase (TIGR01549 family)|nr:HAD-IA family hydrolase [Anaerostipes sp.]
MYSKVKNKINIVRKRLAWNKTSVKDIAKEEEKAKRTKSTVLARKLLEYDVISFDIFDTLIVRTLDKPTDVFLTVGQKLGLLNYTTIRREAELALRDEREAKDGSREVTFEQIYDYMEKYCGIPKEEGMKTEFEMEQKFCIANPYMKEVFDLLVNFGKTVIIVSDMYFPEDMMRNLLSSCGYEGYDKLFVSCDYGYGKRSGKMYQKISKDYLNGRSVIHVGDNEEVDRNMAKENGWNTWWYEDIRTAGDLFRPRLMSPCVGSAYRAMANIKMHSGAFQTKKELLPRYQYGYLAGGIMILGYVSWIHKQAVQEGMDKILFIARDGYIMKKVYDMLYQDIPSEYVYLSRNAALKLTWNFNQYELLKQFVTRRAESEKPYTVEEIFISLEIEHLLETAIKDGWNKAKEIKEEEDAKKLKEWIVSHWEDVSKVYETSQKAFRKYISPMLKGCHHVAAVDTGWRGTCPVALKHLIEKEWGLDCEVTGMMIGSCKYKQNNTLPLIQSGSLRTYIFSPIYNDHLARFHYKNNLIHNTCVEFITSAPHPSVYNFYLDEEGEYKIEFEYPEVENYEITKEIQEGVMDFVFDYKKYYHGVHSFFDISGLDAYWPLRYVMEKRFDIAVRKPLKDYVYNKYVGGLEGKGFMSTFEDMCVEELEAKE